LRVFNVSLKELVSWNGN